MHTPAEFYVRLPVDLFRAGTPTKHKFEYLRTMPPRTEDQVFDVKIDPVTRLIDRQSGGLSLFATPNLTFSLNWWVVPAGTELPRDFTLTKDLTGGLFRGHYSIRAQFNMHEDIWRKTLLEWADRHATHISNAQRAKRRV